MSTVRASKDNDLNTLSADAVLRDYRAGKKIKRRERLEVRSSLIHGKGVFARTPFAEGEKIIRYLGTTIDWAEALRRHPHDPSQPNHTFYFTLDDEYVIDGNDDGNRSRWINHSCEPNCESDVRAGKVFIRALRNIEIGEELNYDYSLVIEEPLTAKLKRDYKCLCGSASCRGTLLSTE